METRGLRATWILLGALLILPATTDAAPARKNVLILRGEPSDQPGGRIILDGLEATVRKAIPSPVEFYIETVDSARFGPTEAYEQRLASLVEEKYRAIPLDLIVAYGGAAVRFGLRERATLFPQTPLLLGFLEPRLIDPATIPPDAGVVFAHVGVADTLRLALQAYPAARRVLVVSGGSRFDQAWLSIVREDLKAFAGTVSISYDADSTHAALLKGVAALPADTIVFYTSVTRDADGDPERAVDVLETLHGAARVPIVGIASTYLGHGILGGALLDLDRHGTDMGVQAVRLMTGEHPAPITTPPITTVDWREYERFRAAGASLPASAVIRYREPGFWERDRKTIVAAGLIVALESALIIALVRVGRRRREAQRLLELRLHFETLLLDLILSLTAVPPDRIADELETEIRRSATWLGIDRVRRWTFPEAGGVWDSPDLRAGQPAFFDGVAELPPEIQRDIASAGWTNCATLAIPLSAADGIVFGALFCASQAGRFWPKRFDELQIVGTTLANVLQRKRAEGGLEQSHRLRGAILASLPAHVAVLDRDGVIIAVNDAWTEFARASGLGAEGSMDPGASYRDTCVRGARDGVPGAAEALALIDAACNGGAGGMSVEYRSDAGTRERWFLMTAEPLRRPERGAVVMHYDISERKMNETALRESEDRFRRMADALPVAIWMSENDGSCSYVNQQWLRMTGRSIDQEAGFGWLGGVHPEDRAACRETHLLAFEARQPFSMEYRIKRHDGKYRWLVDSGMPRYGSDGVFHGYVGGCIDITDRKAAEQTQRHMYRRLMLAQEEERRRIARDLHDHLSQQLALLAIDLQQLGIAPPQTRDALVASLQEAWRRTAEIASDVHALSHRLHPSKMEALGLVATIRAHCRDVSRQSLTVTFAEGDVPAGIGADTALCLYRVLEEALANVAHHSGVTEAHVTLDADPDLILRVSDRGRGFSNGNHSSGLGLVSMRERLEAVGGKLSIMSSDGKGTTVEARVPLPRASHAGRKADAAT